MRIVQGHAVPSNIASVHMDGILKSVSALILGFGLFGDMVKDCEKYRKMGPSRYNGKFSSEISLGFDFLVQTRILMAVV